MTHRNYNLPKTQYQKYPWYRKLYLNCRYRPIYFFLFLYKACMALFTEKGHKKISSIYSIANLYSALFRVKIEDWYSSEQLVMSFNAQKYGE